MAQDSTYNLPNIDRGAAARSKLNSIFEAAKTQNSGSSEPASPSAFMLWADSATDYLKIRNEANTNWNIIGKLNSEGLVLTSAGNPNGAVTGLYEGQLLFDTSNNIPWYYSGSSTSWFTSNGTASSFNLPPFYHDVRINYTDANTITVLADSRVRSSDDTTDIIFSANRTCVLNASGANGLDTGSEAANTWYYLYAIYNPTTLTSALLFSTVNEAVSGSITLPSGFTKKRQLRFAVRNDASSNIIPFTLSDNVVWYRDFEMAESWLTIAPTTYAPLVSGASLTWAAVSLASFIPAISKKAILSAYIYGDSVVNIRGTRLRPTGSGLTTGLQIASGSSAYATPTSPMIELDTNASQSIDYIAATVNMNVSLGVRGYRITEVK